MSSSAAIIGGGMGALAVAILVAVLVLQGSDVAPQQGSDVASQTTAPQSIIKTYEPAQLSLIDIFEMSEAGVVQITVQRAGNDTEAGSLGSGIVFDSMGNIITNAHVVEDSIKTEVTFVDGRTYTAQIVGADIHTDLAVVRVDADPDILMPLRIGDSGMLKVGEPVTAIGNPFGLSGSMTAGIVSQLDRLLSVNETRFSIPDVIQTDAAINPGNSGGPLLNMRGEVIGINTAIQTSTGEFNGVGFAIPSQTVVKIVPTLISDGQYDQPWIGVSGIDISPILAGVLNLTDTRGFLVLDVIEDSPAWSAGLMGSNQTILHDGEEYLVGGDIIVMVDDVEVRKISDILLHLQRSKSVGDQLHLQIIRDGQLIQSTLILDKRPEPSK